MSISLELIEKLKEKVNISYADAKEALEKCNGDLVDALIYLEKENKIKAEPEAPGSCGEKKTSGFWEATKRGIKRCNDTRVVISKNDDTILNISLTIFIILGLVATPFVLVVLLLLLFTGHRFRVRTAEFNETKINKTFDNISDAATKVTDKVTEIINK
jgi:hypothetical protein